MPPSSSASPTLEPLTVTIAGAVARTGISRTTLFRLAGLRQIKMVKSGRRSLIDWASLKAHVASLPEADIRPQL